MKTAQILRRFSFAEWGGTENVVWNTTRELNRRGESAEILATTALNRGRLETVEGVTIRRFPYFYPYFPLLPGRRLALDKKGGNPFVPALERYLRQGDFSLLHCHNLGRLAELSLRAARRRGIPLVVSLHGGCLEVPEAERRELCRPLRGTFAYGGLLERALGWRSDVLAAADGIICVGENELAGLRQAYPAQRILFLPNGVDPSRFATPAAPAFDWRRELGLSAAGRLLLTVSRIDYQKNQKLAVHMLAQLPEEAHLLLIGPVSAQWYYDELQELVRTTGQQRRVTIIPGLPPDDPRLVAAYQQADMFILPSLHEPFGIVVLEAWSAGLPVLASAVGGVGRLVEDGRTGLLFDPNSLDSLLAAYRRLPEYAEQFRANGRRQIAEHYDWKLVVGKLQEFYQSCQEARGRAKMDAGHA